MTQTIETTIDKEEEMRKLISLLKTISNILVDSYIENWTLIKK